MSGIVPKSDPIAGKTATCVAGATDIAGSSTGTLFTATKPGVLAALVAYRLSGGNHILGTNVSELDGVVNGGTLNTGDTEGFYHYPMVRYSTFLFKITNDSGLSKTFYWVYYIYE